ncbi:hypothetical protein [Novosphingobium sp. LASN5T]|uniref:hypothetical protein n=1 Tax=Novosphingobium sp. LASN5T TaxID=2491021 RepID=UPI000F5DCBA5|nr:hypothetical protein [Novosphingobium sp. LASN5T]RQW41375.1 hypothetical protein EH199_19490 [Novosphingobium sp. LASN5T]
MATSAPSRPRSSCATGNSHENSTVSRRRFVGGLATSTLAAVPVAALASGRTVIAGKVETMNMHTRVVADVAEHPLAAQMRASREAANARFWKLHAELEALEAAWEVDTDDSEENWERHAEGVHDATERVLMQGVFCPSAVLAKLNIVHFDPAGYMLPAPVHSAAQVIEWDLERCAKERLLENREA